MLGVQEEEFRVQEPQSSSPQEPPHAALFARRDDVYLLALRLTRHPPDAEDVVQEAYLRALRHENRIPTGIEGWHWFQRIIINTARDRRAADNTAKRAKGTPPWNRMRAPIPR